MGFAVPPGFVASLQTRPRQLMSIQLGWITVADRLSLRRPSDLSVSCSREIFAEVQVGARTVPRSLEPGCFAYSALSQHFDSSVDDQRTSVQRPHSGSLRMTESGKSVAVPPPGGGPSLSFSRVIRVDSWPVQLHESIIESCRSPRLTVAGSGTPNAAPSFLFNGSHLESMCSAWPGQYRWCSSRDWLSPSRPLALQNPRIETRLNE